LTTSANETAADHGDEALAGDVAGEARGQHAVEHEAKQGQQDDEGEHGRQPFRSL
jgi:hypothetical protein